LNNNISSWVPFPSRFDVFWSLLLKTSHFSIFNRYDMMVNDEIHWILLDGREATHLIPTLILVPSIFIESTKSYTPSLSLLFFYIICIYSTLTTMTPWSLGTPGQLTAIIFVYLLPFMLCFLYFIFVCRSCVAAFSNLIVTLLHNLSLTSSAVISPCRQDHQPQSESPITTSWSQQGKYKKRQIQLVVVFLCRSLLETLSLNKFVVTKAWLHITSCWRSAEEGKIGRTNQQNHFTGLRQQSRPLHNLSCQVERLSEKREVKTRHDKKNKKAKLKVYSTKC